MKKVTLALDDLRVETFATGMVVEDQSGFQCSGRCCL